MKIKRIIIYTALALIVALLLVAFVPAVPECRNPPCGTPPTKTVAPSPYPPPTTSVPYVPPETFPTPARAIPDNTNTPYIPPGTLTAWPDTATPGPTQTATPTITGDPYPAPPKELPKTGIGFVPLMGLAAILGLVAFLVRMMRGINDR